MWFKYIKRKSSGYTKPQCSFPFSFTFPIQRNYVYTKVYFGKATQIVFTLRLPITYSGAGSAWLYIEVIAADCKDNNSDISQIAISPWPDMPIVFEVAKSPGSSSTLI